MKETDPEETRPVAFSRTAAKGYDRLPDRVKSACAAALREIAAGKASGYKLKGELRGLRALRLGRSHRIIYREADRQIEVVDIGPRGDIYKK